MTLDVIFFDKKVLLNFALFSSFVFLLPVHSNKRSYTTLFVFEGGAIEHI